MSKFSVRVFTLSTSWGPAIMTTPARMPNTTSMARIRHTSRFSLEAFHFLKTTTSKKRMGILATKVMATPINIGLTMEKKEAMVARTAERFSHSSYTKIATTATRIYFLEDFHRPSIFCCSFKILQTFHAGMVLLYLFSLVLNRKNTHI